MKIIHLTEQDERAYLEQILQKLEWALHHADQAAKQFTKAFRENEEYLYDQRSGMDDADRVSAGQSFKRMAFQGESTIAAKRRLTKLMESPYFGRIISPRLRRPSSGQAPTAAANPCRSISACILLWIA